MGKLIPDQLEVTTGSTNNDTVPTTGKMADLVEAVQPLGINNQTGTTYLVTNTDLKTLITLTNTSDVTLILPEDSTEDLVDGFPTEILQGGSGKVTVATEGSDVVETAATTTNLRTMNSHASIVKKESGVWFLSGDIAEFDPTEIANCVIWLDAADESTVELNGLDVSQWNDKSGNNLHVAQATATDQPLYVNTFNGKKVIKFDGADDFLWRNAGSGSPLLITGDITLFVVLQPLDSALGHSVSHGNDGETTAVNFCYSSLVFATGTRDQELFWEGNGTQNAGFAGTTMDLQFRVLTYIRDATALTGDIYNNSTSETDISYPFNASGSTSGDFYIGSLSNTQRFMNGNIAEVIIYDRKLNYSEHTSVREYLAKKWQIVFTPKEIADCVLWLDAADESTITLNGSNVSQWDDKSGIGNDATQGTAANQPPYSIGGMNNKNVLDLDGISDYMFLPDSFFPTGDGPYSIFIVCQSTKNTGIPIVTGFGSTGTNNQVFIRHLLVEERLNTGWYSNDLESADDIWLVDSDPVLISSHYDQAGREQYLDGTLRGSDSATGKTTASTPNYIGIGAGSGSSWWEGPIAEIIVYERQVTEQERVIIDSYLAAKWGITL